MASLGNASIGTELTEMIVTAAGRQYSTGSTYDVQFRGPTVKVVEYNEQGQEVDMFTYVTEVQPKADWTEEYKALAELQRKNRNKRIFYYAYLTFVGLTCVICFVISLIMGGII